ncbi:peptidyl-tRNA hydrolase [Iodidimonas nitroreducens]|uniref:Peptidyl-tRNA hydrolase n=1 Tax=Iodidimonas nitroreducens TaxID=1236968 RepID=A0A5A7N8I2_9PROT|nr:aminoacyl-tRNA hydrolase [Iodidimonas nitroreducens]GAK33598.1 peptidyl-tRNA hydrolase [alpha proteobacterium Q-1]GER03710.1 peptidyl-tRNA hydrolase [Iodidimonas nitroreducens]
MRLLAGLGNPGNQYADNRHNIGFMAVDEIIRRHLFTPDRPRFSGLVSEGSIDGEKLIIIKPQTYMNESGRAIGEALRYYKLDPSDLIVFHDELDLAPGRMRVKIGGGHAGHNGLRSIISHVGGPDFVRVRLGIGHPGDKDRVVPYVLSDFAKSEWPWVDDLCEAMAAHAGDLGRGDWTRFMTNVAQSVSKSRAGG